MPKNNFGIGKYQQPKACEDGALRNAVRPLAGVSCNLIYRTEIG